MPSLPPRVCRTCGQPGCQVHGRAPWAHRQAPTPRIRGRKLQRLRMALYAREPRCRTCGRVLLPAEMIRDHIVPLEEGGLDLEANTQPLCQGCSDVKTEAERQRGVARSRESL